MIRDISNHCKEQVVSEDQRFLEKSTVPTMTFIRFISFLSFCFVGSFLSWENSTMTCGSLGAIGCDADMVDVWIATLVDCYASDESSKWMSIVCRKEGTRSWQEFSNKATLSTSYKPSYAVVGIFKHNLPVPSGMMLCFTVELGMDTIRS